MNGYAKSTEDLGGQRFFSLLGSLREHVNDLFRKEFNLLKTEMAEKLACLGSQGIYVIAGSLVAYSGVVLILIGGCALIAFAIQNAGIGTLMALGIAFLGLGAVAGAGGYFFLKSALSRIGNTTYSPRATIDTVREMRDPKLMHARERLKTESESESPKTKSARTAAEQKIEQVQTELAEARSRMTPRYLWASARTAIVRRPRLSASVGAGLMTVGYLFLRRRHRRIALM